MRRFLRLMGVSPRVSDGSGSVIVLRLLGFEIGGPMALDELVATGSAAFFFGSTVNAKSDVSASSARAVRGRDQDLVSANLSSVRP